MAVYPALFRNRLQRNQESMLCRVSDTHQHNTRNAKTGLSLSTQDHRSIAYRVPKEWLSLPEKPREMRSLGGFKKKSKNEFVRNYGNFECSELNCVACCGESGERRNVEYR